MEEVQHRVLEREMLVLGRSGEFINESVLNKCLGLGRKIAARDEQLE